MSGEEKLSDQEIETELIKERDIEQSSREDAVESLVKSFKLDQARVEQIADKVFSQ